MAHACKTCGKEFVRKAGLTAHEKRKTPCKPPTKLLQETTHKALVDAGVDSVIGEFREVSKKFNESLSKVERQDQGIFFTPKKVRDLLFDKLRELDVKPTRILEPSFGSGEFLLDAKRLYPSAKLIGVEKNQQLFNAVNLPGAELSCADFLEWQSSSEKADLIIGNPPYFVVKGYDDIYKDALTGRPNIYIMFLYKCLTQHLSKDGTLAFIIPTSLYNSSYYQPMRNYIQKNTTIRWVETLNKPGFFETGQDTMLLVLQNKKVNDEYNNGTTGKSGVGGGGYFAEVEAFLFTASSGNVYISPSYKELYELSKGTTTLAALGLGAKTGNVVWNQVKEKLSDDPGTLLIYSSNMKGDKLVIGGLKGEKKQYVKDLGKPTISGPVILVERGYGNSFRFNAMLVDLKNFYAENHVNVIYPKKKGSEQHMKRVLESLKDERCLTFMKALIGNGSVSATELETILPIF